MRILVSAAFLLGLSGQVLAQSCTGLCLKQVSCAAGATTTITGTVYAPNGVDPLPNVLVFIPNAPVDVFAPGVSCPVVGMPPSGSPLVGTTTAVDGTFTLSNVPVGSNIPLVIQTGRWRRQVVVPTTSACTATSFSTRFPKNQTEGDIPRFAVTTGNSDQVECVLRKVGIDDAEFTDPSGTGRINLYKSSGNPGAVIDAATPDAHDLMGTASTLNSYDVLMLPCEGGQYAKPTGELTNLISFANGGGRIYSSHYSYVWMYQNPPFNGVANWKVGQSSLPDGTATVDTTFSEGQTLQAWLQLVGATTTPGQVPITVLRHDFNGVIPPTQSWLTLNNTAAGNPVMQFVFDTPIASTNQCGRVLFNEYHVENPISPPAGKAFPTECPNTPMNAQEKLLEFSLFELTSDGDAATLTPTSHDFGQQALHFTTAPFTFTWTNNSTFASGVSLLTTTAGSDFQITANNCAAVLSGKSCSISVTFTPTALGTRTGTLTVGSGASTLTASLTGTGVAALAFSAVSLDFGSLDVGATLTKTFTVTNSAPGAVPVPAIAITGDYSAASTCGSSLAAGATCTIGITFKPTTTGPRPGTVGFASSDPTYPAAPVTLTGNGIDFTLSLLPPSGTSVAGYTSTTTLFAVPLAGFAAPLSLTCSTNATASTCTPTTVAFTPLLPSTSDKMTFTTTSKYTVVGYGGLGASGWLWIFALLSGIALFLVRRRSQPWLRSGLLVVLLSAIGMATTGCTGQLPALNPAYTSPGTYAFTVTVTDGFLVHTATYTMNVTAK